MYNTIFCWIICTVATERLAEVVTSAEIFRPLREYIEYLSHRDGLENKFMTWVHKLITCGFCFSLWSAIFFSLFLPGEYFLINATDNILVKAFALWGISNFWHTVFNLVYKGRIITADLNADLNVNLTQR